MEALNQWIDQKGYKKKEKDFINCLRDKVGDYYALPLLFLNRSKIPQWTIPDEGKWYPQPYPVFGGYRYKFASMKLWESEEALKYNWLIRVLGWSTNTEDFQGYIRISTNGENSELKQKVEETYQQTYPVTGQNPNILYNDTGYLINIGKKAPDASIYTLTPTITNTNESNTNGTLTTGFYIGVCNNEWVFGSDPQHFGKVDILDKGYKPKTLIFHYSDFSSNDQNKTLQLTIEEPQDSMKEIFTKWCKTGNIPKFSSQ